GDLPVHHGLVVDDAQSAPGVGHGVLVVGVKGQVLELVPNIGVVGDVVVVQGLEYVLLNELGDHIVGGTDDVVVGAAVFQQGVQGLVALGGLVVDGDARLLLELGDEVLVDIFAPVAHVEHPLAGVGGGGVIVGLGVNALNGTGGEAEAAHQH